MRKILACVLFAAIIIGLALPAMAVADIVLPTAPKADIKIDGVKDDGYGDMFEVKSYRDGGSGTGATAKVWAAWNDKGVCYYMEINDVTPFHEHSNQYERDCVELFIDWNAAAPDANSQSDTNPSWQVRIASAPADDGNQSSGTLGNDTLVAGTDFVTKPLVGSDLKGGYIIEVCLPIALTEGSAKPLASGNKVFVDFQIADNQEDSGRSSQAFLDGTADDVDNQWQWPYAFRGVLPLGDAKPAPTEAPTAAPAAAEVAAAPEAAPAAAPAVVAAPAPVAAQTGDSGAMIFVILGIALAGAVVLTKRVSKDRI